MKIIGFAQLRNELEKGNLENWFRCMNSVCDYIYIYDQASDDGSQEVYRNEPKSVVVQSEINNFVNEIKCKAILLEKLLTEHPDVDWIFWMDGDTMLENKLNDRKKVNSFLDSVDADGILMGHYNLWRSDIYYRVDNLYHWLHETGVCAWWRNNGKLLFSKTKGLHTFQYPQGLTKTVRCEYSLIHRGFVIDQQIIERYNMNRASGLSKKYVARLLDESTLTLKKLDNKIFPPWFKLLYESPMCKEKIVNLYRTRSGKYDV